MKTKLEKVGEVKTVEDLVNLFCKLYYPGQTGETGRPKGMSLIYPTKNGFKVEITLHYVSFPLKLK